MPINYSRVGEGKVTLYECVKIADTNSCTTQHALCINKLN